MTQLIGIYPMGHSIALCAGDAMPCNAVYHLHIASTEVEKEQAPCLTSKEKRILLDLLFSEPQLQESEVASEPFAV